MMCCPAYFLRCAVLALSPIGVASLFFHVFLYCIHFLPLLLLYRSKVLLQRRALIDTAKKLRLLQQLSAGG